MHLECQGHWLNPGFHHEVFGQLIITHCQSEIHLWAAVFFISIIPPLFLFSQRAGKILSSSELFQLIMCCTFVSYRYIHTIRQFNAFRSVWIMKFYTKCYLLKPKWKNAHSLGLKVASCQIISRQLYWSFLNCMQNLVWIWGYVVVYKLEYRLVFLSDPYSLTTWKDLKMWSINHIEHQIDALLSGDGLNTHYTCSLGSVIKY